jgi:hypothetical protein
MSPETAEEIRCELLDLRSQPLASLIDAVANGEDCETDTDLRANLAEAVDHAKTVLDTLRELHKRATYPTPA